MNQTIENKEKLIGGKDIISYMDYMDYIGCNFKNIVNINKAIKFDSNKNVIWVFHHTDLDGYASGHLVERFINEKQGLKDAVINLIPSDYNINFNKFDIQENDMVWLVDLSFTEKTSHVLKYLSNLTKNLYWIDHHESNINLLKSDNILDKAVENWRICTIGGNKNKYSAAMLVYCTLFQSIPEDAPMYIKLTSDWDTWTHDLPDSIYFNEAMNGLDNYKLVDEDLKVDQNSIWIKLWQEKESKNTPILDGIINKGKPIVDDRRKKNERYLRSNGFEFDLFGLDVLVCNMRSNSLLFGDKINDYDLVCPFVLQERNGKLIYTYSLFTAKEDVNCEEIAKIFDGGGHKKAAGFSLSFNLFTDSIKLALYKIRKRKEIKKITTKLYK